MDNDIVPGLLETINKEFDQRTLNSAKLKSALQLLQSKRATYRDVNDYAIEVGQILADVLGANVSVDMLPDGKMYYNIANRLLNETLQKNYDLVAGYATDVQAQLNREAGLGLRAQVPELSHDRIDGIVNRIASESDFEKIQWLLNEPVVTFTQSIVDDAIEKNVEFQSKAGLKPKITRRVVGKACKWCSSLAGSYDYFDKPDDIFRRHERCRCTVEYKPGDGKRQNAWSKKWTDPQKNAKIDARKQIGIKSPLSFPEKRALQQYISSDSYKLNDMLRRGVDLPDQYKQMASKLDSGLDKLPRYTDADPLYRSFTFLSREDTYKFLQKIINDGEYSDKGYVSASKVVYDAKDSARIIINKSHSGTDLKGMNDAEKEVLFKRGTNFKMNDYYLDQSGKPIIEVTERD